jgi:hypothetical protein
MGRYLLLRRRICPVIGLARVTLVGSLRVTGVLAEAFHGFSIELGAEIAER